MPCIFLLSLAGLQSFVIRAPPLSSPSQGYAACDAPYPSSFWEGVPRNANIANKLQVRDFDRNLAFA